MSAICNFDDSDNLYLHPICGGDDGYEWIEADDEYQYFHDFNSYYKFMQRLPALRRLMDKGEFVGNDVAHPIFDP